ncbi:hypothetical protein [Dickeya zeae]|uniref:hypothetical protein n=1 Tax=Dickeya zeae TaxID=204042 RepID=UPI000C9AB066|nr:hypothetical protein [Dickeya zeae]AUQ25116.1 hypothetical protein C1O30_08565 [Dickeya zeae]UJR58199.1 hypothetical protein HJ580_08470 [Dickeya zeae]
MKIELKNLNSFNKFIGSYDDGLELEIDPCATIKLQNRIGPEDLQNIINKYSKNLLPPVNKILPIILYDFTVWTKFKSLPNNIFGGLDTSYKPDKECIYISNKTFTGENNFYNELNKYTENPIDINTATNITLLHELGHAVHHQTDKLNGRYLHEGTEEAKFINELMSFEELIVSQHEFSGKIVEIEMIGRQATREGYADLYCCILLDKLYGKEKANLIIEALYDFRKKVNETEQYYTFDSINEYLTYKNSLNFKSFNEIHSYISDVVSKTAINHINYTAKCFYSHSNFLGIINSVFGINESDVKSAAKKIEDRFPFLCVYHDELVSWRFEHGCKDGEKWLANKDLNKIQRGIRAVKAVIGNKINNIVNNISRKFP